METDEIAVTESSGNVFEDLGFAAPAEALLKAELARQISAIIRDRGLRQVAAARILGVDQPKVSALLRGRLSGFTIDRLVRYAAAFDQVVDIAVHPREHDDVKEDLPYHVIGIPSVSRDRRTYNAPPSHCSKRPIHTPAVSLRERYGVAA